MPKLKTILIAASLLGVGSGVAAVAASQALGSGEADADSATPRITTTDSPPAGANAPSLYADALAAATALRGVPAAAAVGRPVSLEMVVSLLRAASFGPGPTTPAQWTLFLPTDAAFAPLAGEHLDVLVHHPNAMFEVLDRHLVAGALSLEDLRRGGSVSTFGGQPLEVAVGDTPRVNGAAVLAEQRVGNGRIFIIDGLL